MNNQKISNKLNNNLIAKIMLFALIVFFYKKNLFGQKVKLAFVKLNFANNVQY